MATIAFDAPSTQEGPDFLRAIDRAAAARWVTGCIPDDFDPENDAP